MSRCLRGIILLCALGLLLFSVPTYAQTSQVVIAVIHPGDAMNPVIEEVYYKANPNSEIVYALYAEDQLKTALLSGKIDFDLLIQPIEQVHSYGKDGYLEKLYSVMGFAHWPDDFLDIQHQIELEGSLYGLPVAVYQTVWSWNDALAQATGIKKPSLPWTWDDYKALSELLPVDINMDGTKDAYLMYGQKTQDAALSNVQLDNLYTYFRSYPGDFSSERFRNQLDIFAGIVNTPSLLPIDTASPPLFNDAPAVLITYSGAISPLLMMDGRYSAGSFLPPPVFEADDVFYLGSASVCAMMKNAPHRDEALAFLTAMLSPEAKSTAYIGKNMVDLVYKQMPNLLWSDDYSIYQPSFAEKSNNRYIVPKGRAFNARNFPYTQEQFDSAQDFRSLLKVSSLSVGRPFYDAVVKRLVPWINGAITLDATVRGFEEVYSMIVTE